MGKGDKKTKKGKIAIGSYGVSRPKKKIVTASTEPKPSAKKSKSKK
jgi:30S ribosomal protein S31